MTDIFWLWLTIMTFVMSMTTYVSFAVLAALKKKWGGLRVRQYHIPDAWSLFFLVGCGLAIARIGSLWFLMLKQWYGVPDLRLFFLGYLLFPESALLAVDGGPSLTDTLMWSVALFVGSFVLALPVFLAYSLFKYSKGKTDQGKRAIE